MLHQYHISFDNILDFFYRSLCLEPGNLTLTHRDFICKSTINLKQPRIFILQVLEAVYAYIVIHQIFYQYITILPFPQEQMGKIYLSPYVRSTYIVIVKASCSIQEISWLLKKCGLTYNECLVYLFTLSILNSSFLTLLAFLPSNSNTVSCFMPELLNIIAVKNN